MSKHSVSGSYLLEVFDGSILSEVKVFNTFSDMTQWFAAEVSNPAMMEPSSRRELADKVRESGFYSVGTLIDTWHAVVGIDHVGGGVTFSVSTRFSITA